MTNQLTQEELVLSIGEQITLRSDLTVDNLIKTLLPVSPTNDQPISSVLRSFIAKEFFRQMKNLCRFSAKNYIACQLKNGTSEFIRQFVAAKEDEQFIEIFPTNLKTRMRILKENGVLGSLIVECVRVFNRLREKFSPMQSEDQLRIFLSEWFQSGFMTLAIWKAFEEWKRKGPTLANLRAMTEPSGAQSDTKWREFKRLLITIKTDNFVELEKMRKILDIFFAPPQLSVSDSKVKLVGRILYLSEWVTRLEDSIKSNSAVEVAIFAEDNLGIDCDLTATVWQGKNLIIVSKCVNVWREARIRLSGLSYVSDKRKAASAHSTVYRGADGRHGRPGESSGNLAILTTQMLNATRLTVELSGGRGENGEDGGDGCDGANGVGVTQDDLNRLVVSYNSLYRDSWSNFDSYGPPSNWKIQSNSSSSRCYIYRTYKDEHNRMMTYSFAADKGWTYSTYDLYLLIRGSNGTSGTSGGSNGVGGQGGYNGSFTVKNPETNEDYPIKVIKEGKSNGPNGENGQVGVSGKCGVNGNDLALIDRSAAKASKFYQGSADKKLDWDYFFKADDTNRLNGYRRYQEKESACFIKFKHGEVIQMEQTRANKAQEQTVRQKASEAVAKQSILISKAISEAESMFGKQSAFLADACEESAKAALSNEVEEEEEEATENVTEEVVVLRQKEETNKLSKYTPESEKLVHTIKTPELYAATVKLLGSKATLNKLSQALFDFFDLEFPPALLDSFSLCTLFQQRLYRQRTQSSLAMVLVSSLQQKIVNGKSYEEIKAFNATLPERRKQKLNLSRLRQKFQNISKETDGELVQPSLNLLPESDHYFGVKDSRLSERLARYTERNNVKKVVDVFFGQYIFKEADLPLLDALNTFLNKITPQYKQLLEQFATDLEWTDNEKTQDYLDSLSGWLIEDEKLRKEAEKSKEEYKPLSRPTTPLESDFVSFYKAVVADSKYWKSIVESVNRLISKNGEYTARFGPLPGSSMVSSLKNKFWTHEDKNIEQARYLIKIYYLAKSILTFNRSLYVYNAMMRKELGQFSDDINYFNNGDQFDNFLNQCAKTPIKTDGDECLKYMTTNGLNCAPFRYLLSLHLNVKLCSYRQVSFQTLKKIETMNSTAVETESIWLREMDLQPTGIAADKDIRELVAAQAAMISKYNAELTAQMASLAKIDFAKRENILMFVSYFPSSLQASACEWIESYIASTQDLSLIQLLYSRMWVDGCHLTLFELQSVLVMFTSLKELFHCDLNYLLLLANSAPQSKLVDVFLYLRLEYHLGHRFANESRIFNSIQSIQNSRYKSLLAVKLTDYHLPIDDEDLYKITLMLQNASNGAEQLEKIGLDEWVSIARKQKWSEIGYLLQQYGSIGYYLGLLDSKSFREEEKKMRELFDQTTIIPEKLVALYTQWIVTRESDVNIFDRLKMLFLRANHYPELELDENQNETKCQLATNELEQTKLLKWMLNGEFYETVHTTKDRSIDELVDKITGLHDSPEKAIERKESVRRIAELLKKNDTQSSASVYWLNKFDEALYKLKKKRLRDTQKMAILCAIEGGKRVLEQVNTGEGKSFIIAAIATIHLKTGKRYVDVITSSPVLAQRDSDEMSELYEELGLTVAHNCSEDMEERKKAYNARIVYGDIARFQRDYLLHTFYKKLLLGDRTQVAVIVDEVDNMLLDNGNNMLYLSHTVPGIDLLDSLLVFIQQQIHSPIFSGDKSDLESMQEQFDSTAIKRRVLADLFGHFSIEDLKKLASYLLSEEEIKKTYENLIKNKVIDADGYLNIHTHEKLTLIETALESNGSGLVQLVKTCFSIIISRERKIELPVYLRKFAKLHLEELIENCKQAVFLQPDTGYVVDVDRTGKLSNAIEPLVTIIDPNTGADLASSQWTGGLHQFLQLKHGCRLSPMSLKAVFVSNVAYLKRYEYINGLSGTLGSTEESKTLIQLYQADLIKIPTNKPKVFYEHVPVIAVVREQWIANIYDEICDQVIAKRAVLVICEDIKQLEYIHMGLIRLFEADTRASQEVKECFTHVTTYKREHDEFNFEDEHKFEPHRLIIATNLAGRGTDIKLSDQVIKAGGMHVIVSFMPKNCRIEEQAFGRAARCGQPGSGQIIAFAEPLANAPQPSVFQLKTFRDNAEVHRLQSLNNFYKYHTEIEESCLEIFHNYIDSALSKMYNSPNSSGTDDAALPTPSHVVYFTLLDEWALWLDSKAPLIKQCSIEYSDKLKQAIIESVEEFKENHAFEDENKSNSFEVAKSWIVSPQALLTIGIIQMSHKDGFREAEETFNRVLADGCEFAGEAFYYKACMRMRNFEGLRKTANSLKLAKKEKFKEDIEEAIEYFYKARTCFLHRLHRKEREASLVAQMIEKLPANNPKTSGYASQIKSITTYIQMILANIDYLLGSPSHQFMFAIDGISEKESKKIHDLFVRQGLISPTLLTGRSAEDWQIEPFRQKYKLQRNQIENMLKEIAENPTSLKFEKYVVLDPSSLIESCPLSTKSEFWVELESQHTLKNTVVCLFVQDQSVLSSKLAEELNKLEPFSLENPDDVRTLLRYSSQVSPGTLYKLDEVKKHLEDKSDELMIELNQLVSTGRLKLDKLAQIRIVPKEMTYFSRFDGITFDDLREYFRLDTNGAAWILNNLQENGVLELETVKMMRFTRDNDKWESHVRSLLKDDAKPPTEGSSNEFKLLYKNAGALQTIKNTSRILNVSKDVIKSFCKVPDDTLDAFYSYLENEKILEPYLYKIWRQNSKLNCSSLPSCIADHVDEFLADRFAYSFALENICMSLEEANKDATPKPSQVFLPENPFRDIAADLVRCGLAMPARICASSEIIEDIDFDGFENAEPIRSVVYSNRIKLYDQTDFHMELLPLASYARDQGFLVDSDLNSIISNGLKLVVARKKQTTSSFLLNKILAVASSCWNAIKFVANKIGSFCYSVVKFAINLPGKIFSKICEFAAPYVKQAGALIMRIARPLLNTKLGKAAASAVNAAVNGAVWATYKVVDGVEWVIDKSKKAVNKVSKVASDAVNWIADTKVAQGAVGLVKDAASWVASTSVFQSAVNMAMYVYTKVSNFCTAIVESYHYYNQCRTISRRIVNEKGHLVDEHTILKTFQGISLQEAKKAENALDEDGNIRNHIESWRTALTESLLITFSNKLEKVHHDKYKVDFVKSFLKTSSALSHLESELNKMLNFHAWDKQIEYFKQVKASFEGKTTSIQMDRIHVERLPIHLLFFVEDAIEQMLKDLESRFDDEAYESSAETSDSDDIETANLVDLDKHKTWKEALTAVFSNRVHKSVEFAFIEKTISVVLGYIAAMRDTNMDPSEAQFGFVQEDKQLKQALLEYTTSNQSKQKAMFLLAELHHISQKLIDSDTHSQMKIIRHAIKYGYPLPLSSANLVANAFERFLRESKIYSAGIDLLVQDDNGKVAVAHKVGGGKAKVHIRHFNGSVFICQSDYRASISMSDHMHEEVDSAFFYEAFVSHMKNLKEAFPNQAETLRAGLLNVFVD